MQGRQTCLAFVLVYRISVLQFKCEGNNNEQYRVSKAINLAMNTGKPKNRKKY